MSLDEMRQLIKSGIESYDKGNFKDAIANFEAALKIDSTESKLYMLLGMAYTDDGDHDKAITNLQKSLQLQDDDPGLYIMLARAYARNGDYQYAVNCYDTVISLAPENPEHRISRADLLIRANNPSGAIEDIECYLQINQSSSLAYEIRGRAREALNDLDNAIEDYSESLRLESKSISARVSRAYLYKRMGQFSKALEDYIQLVNNNPDNTDFLFMRAETYHKVGDHENAQQDFEMAFRMYDQGVPEKDRFKSKIFPHNIYGNIESAKALFDLEHKRITNRFYTAAIPAFSLTEQNRITDLLSVVALLNQGSPESVLKCLIQHRIEAIEKSILAASDKDEAFSSLLNSSLINPIFLASVIALAKIRGSDELQYLKNYVEGGQLNGLDNEFLLLEGITNEIEMAQFLDVENQYIDAFFLLGLESLLYSQVGAEIFPKSYCESGSNYFINLRKYLDIFQEGVNSSIPYDQIQWSKELPENCEFNAFHVILQSWIICNPFYLCLGWHTACRYLAKFGWQINSPIHNAREHFEFLQVNLHGEITNILASNMTSQQKKATLEGMRKKQENLARLVRRSVRLYYWNPMEAEAKAFVTQSVRENFRSKRTS